MHTYINCGRDGWQGSQSYAFLCGFLSGHGGVIRAHRGEGEIKGAWLAALLPPDGGVKIHLFLPPAAHIVERERVQRRDNCPSSLRQKSESRGLNV